MSENAAAAIDNDVAVQLSKERRMLEKNKENKRLIALEAMQMAEKRRIREKQKAMGNHVAATGGSNIREIKKQHEIQFSCAKERSCNNALVDTKNIQVNEDVCVKRTADEFQGKLKFKDEAKVEEKRRLKQIQIKNYLDELAREKIRKQRKENELKRGIENRTRSEEVNHFQFDRQKRLETINSMQQHRRIIMKQMEERKQIDQEKISLNETNLYEEKAFFSSADELVHETCDKDRPVYPVAKVIDEPKRTSNVNPKKFIYAVDELKALRPQK